MTEGLPECIDDVCITCSDMAVEVTVVRGTRDRLCPADWADAVAGAAPRGRSVEIPGAAHMTVQTHPDRVATIIREAAAGRPTPETMRRLNLAILAHQDGTLQDDATTVLVEWLTDQPERSTP